MASTEQPTPEYRIVRCFTHHAPWQTTPRDVRLFKAFIQTIDSEVLEVADGMLEELFVKENFPLRHAPFILATCLSLSEKAVGRWHTRITTKTIYERCLAEKSVGLNVLKYEMWVLEQIEWNILGFRRISDD
jgi:hypothetical protein